MAKCQLIVRVTREGMRKHMGKSVTRAAIFRELCLDELDAIEGTLTLDQPGREEKIITFLYDGKRYNLPRWCVEIVSKSAETE